MSTGSIGGGTRSGAQQGREPDPVASAPALGSGDGEAKTTALRGPPVDVALHERHATVGANVGRYVVLEEIGRGGMGRVLRAYDPKLRREVAVKEVRGDVLGTDGAPRLVAEAQAMAMLSHPNVVPIYDVDELDDDRVVLVMEYVAGATLGAWLGERERGWREVVDRFVLAGQGLAAAHAAGLLHRDFKPANVLIGAGAAVKVTDFGLARVDAASVSSGGNTARDSWRRGDSSESEFLCGTPRYMAPEQHAGDALTATADQYAFCVALWEALCGAAPFSGDGLAAQKRAGPPTWPTGGPGVQTVPRVVANAVRRGLAAEPGERWPSMVALLDVLTANPSRRRNRWLMAGGVVAALMSLAGGTQALRSARSQRCSGAAEQLAGVWDEGRRAQIRAAVLSVDASYADAVWERTSADLERYATQWVQMHTEACEATTLRGEQSSAVLDLRVGCLTHAKLDLAAATEVLARADRGVVQRAHAVVGGLQPLSRCADVAALLADVAPPLPKETEAVQAARVLLAEAQAQRAGGHYSEALSRVEQASSALEGIEYGPVRTELAMKRGDVLDAMGKYDASQGVFREALLLASKHDQRREMQEVAARLIFIVGHRLNRAEEGLRYREIAEGLADGDPVAGATVASNIASVLSAQGRYEEAETQFRRGLAHQEAVQGPEHLSVVESRVNLANVVQRQGRYEEAEAEYRRALELITSALGPDHPDVARSINNLATVLWVQGKREEAENQMRRALAVRESALRPDHPETARVRHNLGFVLTAQGRYEEAEVQYRRALVSLEAALGADHPRAAGTRNNLADVLAAQGKYAQAEVEYRRALPPLIAGQGEEHTEVALSRSNFAATLLKRDKTAEALTMAEDAWRRHRQDDVAPARQAETAFVLAQALWAADATPESRNRARALAEQAAQGYQRAGDGHDASLDEVRSWLGGIGEP